MNKQKLSKFIKNLLNEKRDIAVKDKLTLKEKNRLMEINNKLDIFLGTPENRSKVLRKFR